MVSAARIAIPIALLAALLSSACGMGEAEGRRAFEVVAKVNEREIQANELSAMLGDSTLAQAGEDGAHAAALERLIDRELMVQQARERSLDRDPRVLRSIEAAQREILARAYLEQVTSQSAPPTDSEIAAFYAAHPELFAQRRIYSLQELEIRLAAARFSELQDLVARAASVHEVMNWLDRERVPFQVANAVKPAEQLPLESLQGFARMKDGQMVLSRSDAGALLVHLVSARGQPLDEASARPLIERYLVNARKLWLAKAELERLRDRARIEYGDASPPPAKGVGVSPAVAAVTPAAAGTTTLRPASGPLSPGSP